MKLRMRKDVAQARCRRFPAERRCIYCGTGMDPAESAYHHMGYQVRVYNCVICAARWHEGKALGRDDLWWVEVSREGGGP